MTHSVRSTLVIALLLWAGASIGANMIAAPAKFTVNELTRPVALQVGRMQFQWVGYFEYAMAALGSLVFLLPNTRLKGLVCVVILTFLTQRLGVLPLLSQSTDQVIAGHSSGGSHLHLIFIALEAFKLVMILIAAIWALQINTQARGAN